MLPVEAALGLSQTLGMFKAFTCVFVTCIPSIERGFGLEEKDTGFLQSHGLMFDATWDDQELAWHEDDVLISKSDQELAGYNEKEFVFMVMFVPDELSMKLCQFNELVVEFPCDSGVPEVMELAEFLLQIDLLHG